jgi:hypothetical protein
VAFKQASSPDVYGLDDSEYRDYSRTQLAQARIRKVSAFGKSVDFLIAIVLLTATLLLVLWHLGTVSIP